MERFLKKQILLYAAAALLATNEAAAQEKQDTSQKKQTASYSFSVEQAIEYGIQNKQTVLNAAVDQEIAQKKVNELKGIGLPQINGFVDAKKFFDIPTQVVPASAFGGPEGLTQAFQFGLAYNASAGVDASQLLFDGTYIVGLQASKTYVELSEKTYQQSKIETAEMVSKAYYNVLVSTERMEFLDANIARIKKLMDDTKAFYDNGFVEKIDVDRVQVTYNNLTNETERAKKNIELSKLLLKFQMGMDLKTDLTLTDNLKNIKFEEAMPADEPVDYTKRIEYSILQTNQHLQELDLKKNRFQYLPSLYAYADLSTYAYRYDFDFFDSDKGWYPTSFFGAKMSIPVFDGMQRRSRIAQAKLELKKTESNFKLLEQSISLETESSKIKLQNNIASLITQGKNRDLAEEVSRVSKIKYDQGVGSNLEVVTAETDYKEAVNNYYLAMYEAIVAKIDYLKATGTLIKN
ncbi:MAG: TolC family protein [Bacteroidia bacterium]